MSKRNPYIREIKPTWWLDNPFFTRYMLREGTSVLVLLFSIELFFALKSLLAGEDAWLAFLQWLSTPFAILFHILCFSAVMLHACTWFYLAPKTMDIRIKGQKVPDTLITQGHFIGLILASVTLLIIIGGFV